MPTVKIIDDDSPTPASSQRDDVAYMLPMGLFLAFTWVGGQWPDLYAVTYIAKTILVAIVIWYFWPRYTTISWKHAWLGAIVGVVVVFQWVGMEKLILNLWPDYPRLARPEAYDPFRQLPSDGVAWAFIAIRWMGASLLVPVMEELFWRDYLWRTVISPNDFKLAKVGEWDWKAFFLVALVFGAGVHLEWMTAIVCGLIYGAVLVWTRSLGACIIAHGVTNFLLGAYVLIWRDWKFW